MGLGRGAVLPASTAAALAREWYATRLDLGWRSRTPPEAEEVFASVGLSGPFWAFDRPGRGGD